MSMFEPLVPPWPVDPYAAPCDGAWSLVGTDLVAGRVTDHVACAGAVGGVELWIDRELQVALRVQTPEDMTDGVSYTEITELILGPVDPSLFDVPDDVEIEEPF